MNIIKIKQFLFAVMAMCLWAWANADTYSYDKLNRLTAVAYTNGGGQAFSYDAAGNVLVVNTTIPVSGNYILSVSLSGSGTVSGGGIDCGLTCSASLASGTKVTLTASPASGSSFTSWSGACTGTSTCTVTMSKAQSVTATFNISTAGTTIFPSNRSNYRIVKSGGGYGVQDISTGKITLLNAAASVKFDDITINLLIGDLSKTLDERDLKTLIELYVAFFNRIPEADGLAYWISEFKKGTTLAQIADSFYAAAIGYTDLTGYSASMTNADFVWIIYKNVLGRTGVNAPPDADVQYWADLLTNGEVSKGGLLSIMLASAHSFEGHPTWGWVPQLLDNKVKAAKIFSLQQGLNYNTPELSIARGMAIAAAVTSAGIDDAVALMQLSDTSFNLLLP